MRRNSFNFLYLLLLLIALPVNAKPIDDASIPPQLKPWKSWVLHGSEQQFCPNPFNSKNEYLCIWPSRLNIKLNEKGGTFSQQE